jgi:hypothetical protein
MEGGDRWREGRRNEGGGDGKKEGGRWVKEGLKKERRMDELKGGRIDGSKGGRKVNGWMEGGRGREVRERGRGRWVDRSKEGAKMRQ